MNEKNTLISFNLNVDKMAFMNGRVERWIQAGRAEKSLYFVF